MALIALRAADLTLLFIAFSSSEVRTSPAITTRFVVASVSQATRTAQGSMPDFAASRKNRSTTSSEMRSHTLSGWPSETDSLVKR